VFRDRAQRVEQLAVFGALTVAEQCRDVGGDHDRRRWPNGAADGFGVAFVFVVGTLFVGGGGSRGSREQVLAGILRVGVLLDAFGQLFDLEPDRVQVALVVGAVGGLHQQFTHALHDRVDVGHRARGRVLPRDTVLRVAFVGAQPFELALQVDYPARAIGVVGRFEDRPARRQFVGGPFERCQRAAEVGERRARDHRWRDPGGHRYSPTTPVCSISVSSIESIAVSVRADAW
jgi:hypothetical protein